MKASNIVIYSDFCQFSRMKTAFNMTRGSPNKILLGVNNKMANSLKPISHQNANPFVLGPCVGLDHQPDDFVAPILLPARTSIVLPVGLYEPTYRSSPHIPVEEVMWKAEEEVYSDNLLRRRRLSE